MGYYKNDGLIFAWDLGVIFLGVPNWKPVGFQKKEIFVLKVSLKNVWVFSMYTYFEDFYF